MAPIANQQRLEQLIPPDNDLNDNSEEESKKQSLYKHFPPLNQRPCNTNVKVLKAKRTNYVDEDGYLYYDALKDDNNDFIYLKCTHASYGSCPCEIEITSEETI